MKYNYTFIISQYNNYDATVDLNRILTSLLQQRPFTGEKKRKSQQSVVSIHGPLGYGPSTLPLRHSADTHYQLILSIYLVFKGCHCVRNYFPHYFNHFCFICNQNIATVRDPKYIDVIYINERCTQLNKILLNMFSILPPIISPDHFVCTMGGVVFFVTILK